MWSSKVIRLTCMSITGRTVATFEGIFTIGVSALYQEPYPAPILRYNPNAERWFLTNDKPDSIGIFELKFEPVASASSNLLT